jgi:hypothetical protein
MKTHFYPVCSVTKATEGGISQKDILAAAERRGIDCRVERSCYVGQTAVLVKTEDWRKIDAFVNEILC